MQSAVLSAIKEFIDFQRQHATICIHFNFKKLNQAHYDGPTKKAGKKKKQEYIESSAHNKRQFKNAKSSRRLLRRRQ